MGKTEIIWSPDAKSRFEEVYMYLLTEWSERVADNFRQQALDQIDLLATFPNLGVPVDHKYNLHKLLLTTHNYLYYLFNDGRIIIIDIIDTRQEPIEGQ